MPGTTTKSRVLQNAATTNINGSAPELEGYDGLVYVEVQETAGGTATLTLEGSFDGTTWYGIGYQLVSATASPARSVTAISVTANLKAVYQVLDLLPQVRARTSSVAGGATVTVKLYAVA